MTLLFSSLAPALTTLYLCLDLVHRAEWPVWSYAAQHHTNIVSHFILRIAFARFATAFRIRVGQ